MRLFFYGESNKHLEHFLVLIEANPRGGLDTCGCTKNDLGTSGLEEKKHSTRAAHLDTREAVEQTLPQAGYVSRLIVGRRFRSGRL
jgi:hypothetical protein